MIVCVALTADGRAGQGWGRAPRVAVADVIDGQVRSWQEYVVGWDAAHDSGTEGAHHARVVTFLREHEVERVAAGHMGPGMVRTLERLGVEVRLGAAGDPRAAAVAAAG